MFRITLSAAVFVLFLTDTARAQHCENIRANLSSNGQQAPWGGEPHRPAISADGRYVAFWTSGPGLIPGIDPPQPPFTCWLALRDTWAGTIERIDVGTGADQWGYDDDTVSISGDGRYVAFDSFESNLVPGDGNSGSGFQYGRDVFVRDRLNATTERISVDANGVEGNFSSATPAISADGRFVAFASLASNLVAGDGNGTWDIFVRDRQLGTIERVSVDANGVEGETGPGSILPDISPDGRFVAFLSDVNLWAPSGIPGVRDVFLKDRLTSALELCSVASWGEFANALSTEVKVSSDGRYVVFVSNANNLVIEGDPNGNSSDVYVRDRLAGTTLRASVADGAPMTGGDRRSYAVSISSDARSIAFASEASNLTSIHVSLPGVFVHDMVTNATELISQTPQGAQGDSPSMDPTISSDGKCVAFVSSATNLVPGDTNSWDDVIVFRRECLPPSSTSFCYGDGSGTPCPCGNAGTGGNGCASSFNASGAHLFSSGYASVLTDTFVLHGSGMSSAFTTYFQGTQRANAGAGAVFGDGLRCAGGTIIRLGAINSPGGASQYPNATDPKISVRGSIPSGGGVTRTYQGWYRNAAAFCTSATFNLTNGLEATWAP